MKAISHFTGIYIHREPVDMRRGINGLCDIVQMAQMGTLKEGHLFVFSGKQKSSIKILYFDRTGFCLWQKRLEKDRFPWPKEMTETVVRINSQQLEWLLEGFEVWKMKPFSEQKFEKVC